MNDLPTGTLLNKRYIVNSCIGKDGLGTVYLCLDKFNDKDVAIKEISFEIVDSNLFHNEDVSASYQHTVMVTDEVKLEGIEQKEKSNLKKDIIISEFRMLKEFNDDPDFLSVYDVFEENESLYLVMEFLEGESLRNLISNGVIFEDEEIREIGLLILRPLKKLHNINVLHNDICPNNIMIGHDVQVKLIDFDGVDSYPKKSKNMWMFRNGYSAPEVCITHDYIGIWSELYSLGATLYEMATGNRIPAVEERIENDTVVSPREINQKISVGLSDTIMKAISLNPRRRFQTDNQFEKALIKEDKLNSKLERWVAMGIGLLTVLVILLQIYCG